MIKAAICQIVEEFATAPPGAVLPAYREKEISSLMVKCPGCGQVSGLQIQPHVDKGNPNSWDLTGWPDAVTLSPGVHHSFGCGWHGRLKKGIWKTN